MRAVRFEPVRTYCTYFDRNYLPRGLALYRSLTEHASPMRLRVLALDDETYATLEQMSLPHMDLLALPQFEADDPHVAATRATRQRHEYYWTLTPALILSTLRQVTKGDLVTYVDADLFFFADPEPLYREMGSAEIMIAEHRYAPRHAHAAATRGIYNVGIAAFRAAGESERCLTRWREQCIEWCYDRIEPGRFGDQKYLDDWPQVFPSTHVMRHKGGALAPWNITNYRIGAAGGTPLVDDVPVIDYHFHSLRIVREWLFEPAARSYGIRPAHVRLLYRPYARALRASFRDIRGISPGFRPTTAHVRLRGQVVGAILTWLFWEFGASAPGDRRRQLV